MKKVIQSFLFLAVVAALVSPAQAQRVRLLAAGGASAYYGDLMQGTPVMKKLSSAFTIGASYDLSYQMRARLSISRVGIQADDKDNKRDDYKLRNLNFKNNIWDINLGIEYDILNSQEYALLPYVFAGPSVFFHNPTTIDAFGQKQNLREWGTEGQGLKSYPDRKPYSLTQFALGFGGGLRYELSDNVTLGIEGFVRKTFTDYLDDVSKNGYVPQSVFNAEGNPYSYYLAYRTPEVDPNKPFGKNRPRGNPNDKDVFYSLQLKLTYRLENLKIGPDLDLYSGGYRGYPWRNPRFVL